MKALDEVRNLQAALLVVLDSEMTPTDKGTAAGRLLHLARACEVPELAVPALAFVLDRHVAELTEDPAGFGAPTERRLLEMHARGEVTCQRCARPLPAKSTVLGWARERHLAAGWRDRLRDRGAA